jgi:ubiquinone/menaquinone biosynthesis C-methylase UbiE
MSGDTVARVLDYYEQLWERLPEDLAVPDFARRRAFLLGEAADGERALDLGCGAGDFTAELARAEVQAVGADVAQAAIARASRRHPGVEFRVVPFDGPLPFDDGAFELVWASEVIEHVADTAMWLSEVRRVLVPGGRLLVTTPSHGRLPVLVRGVERFSEPLGDHLHLYTRRSLAQLLNEFAFGAVRIRAVGGVPLLWRTSLWARATR